MTARVVLPSRSRPLSTVQLPHVENGQSIGLLGGSFNPAHEAHVLISETALKRLGLDRMWWLVTPGNPFKSAAEATPLHDRVRGAREMAGSAPITVTDFEKELSSPYTIETLLMLRRVRPNVRFVWVMGADCLAEFHKWRSWRSIFQTLPVAVIDRPGFHLKALASPAAQAFARYRVAGDQARGLARGTAPSWIFLTGPLSTQSSTKIRAARRSVI